MKLISLAVLFLSLTINQKDPTEIKLEGKYRMEYEANYVSENCTIKINGETYEKKLNNGSKRKGKVETLKQKFGKLFILKDKDSELEVDIQGKTYHVSDIIFFRTKKVNEKDEDALTVYAGKLIRIK